MRIYSLSYRVTEVDGEFKVGRDEMSEEVISESGEGFKTVRGIFKNEWIGEISQAEGKDFVSISVYCPCYDKEKWEKELPRRLLTLLQERYARTNKMMCAVMDTIY